MKSSRTQFCGKNFGRGSIGAVLIALLLMVEASAAPQVKHRVVDKRNSSSVTTHFILFCAKPANWNPTSSDYSIPGHTWIAWGTTSNPNDIENGKFNTNEVLDSYGFYPTSDAKLSAFQAVPGDVRYDFITKQDHVRFVVFVSEAQSKAIQKSVTEKRNSCSANGYKILINDCISFMSETAKALDLLLPDRSTFTTPQGMVDKLADLNGASR